jgi:hypothetical protein
VGIRFDPLMSSVRSGLPAITLVGEIDEIDGNPGEVDVTLKFTESVVKSGTSAAPCQVCTNTLAVTDSFSNAAGITAVS